VRTFLARRAERVVPLYWLATTAKLVLTLALPALAVGALGGVWHVVASYLFLPSYSVGTLPYPILAPGWTLNYEMFFYLLVAIGLGLRLRIVPYVSVVLAVLGVLGFFRPEGFPAICSLVDPLLLEFMYGILLVVLLPRLRSEKVWQKVVAGVAFVSGFGLMALHVGENYRPERALIWGVPAMLIVGSALALEESVGRHVPRWLLVLGDGSYSLYLSHVLVLAALGSVLQRHHEIGRRSRVAEELLVALVCVAGGMITYRLVEKPIMSYFKGRRKRAVPVVV
jgi:exopolysaccharide production protein ExoZ